MEKYNIMKIAKIVKQNRSKKGKNKLDVYIRFYSKPKPIENRLKGMFLYKKPQNAIQTNHNKNINYEIEQHLNQLIRDQRLGLLDIEDYNAPTENIRQWAENWLDTKDFGTRTRAPYNVVLDLFDEYFGKGKTFVDVRHEHAMKFRNWLRKDCVSRYGRKYSVNSLNTYLNRMKLIFEEAMKQGLQTYKRKNPFVDGLYFPKKVSLGEYISSEEYNLLDYKKCLAPEQAKAFMFSILTGLRTGDLKKILWKDIVKDEKGWFSYFRMNKGDKPIRVSFPKKCMDLMGERGAENERVFKYSQSNQENTYFNTWISQSLPKKRIGQADDGLVFHSARNSFVTNLLMKGVPPVRVQKYVGHKDLKTTLSYYRGSTEMQEIDIQSYMDDIEAKRSLLKAKNLLS